jgi:translation elongation factor EF-G
MQEYHSRLKSLTAGEGNFTMDFSHYAEVNPQTAGVERQASAGA